MTLNFVIVTYDEVDLFNLEKFETAILVLAFDLFDYFHVKNYQDCLWERLSMIYFFIVFLITLLFDDEIFF